MYIDENIYWRTQSGAAVVQWLARLPGTQEIRGSNPGHGMTDFCTSIFIFYINACITSNLLKILNSDTVDHL